MQEEIIKEAVDYIPIPKSPQSPTPDEGEKISVKRGKVDSINIYEISESELTIIEAGAPSSIYLNFTTFFGGVFLSFISVLFTVSFNLDDNKQLIIFILFLLIDIVTCFLTIIMGIIWLIKKKDLSTIIKRIKERIN